MYAGGKVAVLSVLDWWHEAGVDVLVDETPRDWLAPPATKAAPAAPALPARLDSFHAWLGDQAEGATILPSGNARAGLMLMTAVPTAFDTPQTGLFAGAEGRLLDAMLAAIGRDRAACYLASLAPVRPDGGRTATAEMPERVRVARHHIALAAPKALLLLGNEIARAILGLTLPAARGKVHRIDFDGVIVNVVVTFSPQMLLERLARKADCWADLRRLLEELNR